MLYFFLGPLVFFCGLGVLYLGIHALPPRRVPRPPSSRPTFGREDQLMGEVLTEMLKLRKEVAGLKAEVGVLRPAIAPPG
jgi:hypothetical protein